LFAYHAATSRKNGKLYHAGVARKGLVAELRLRTPPPSSFVADLPELRTGIAISSRSGENETQGFLVGKQSDRRNPEFMELGHASKHFFDRQR
jgi:hypothetical protein